MMSDLEAFIEFFTMKGVPFSEWPPPDAEVFDDDHETDGLAICDAILKFNDDGKFVGVFNYESGHFSKRIPAPATPTESEGS